GAGVGFAVAENQLGIAGQAVAAVGAGVVGQSALCLPDAVPICEAHAAVADVAGGIGVGDRHGVRAVAQGRRIVGGDHAAIDRDDDAGGGSESARNVDSIAGDAVAEVGAGVVGQADRGGADRGVE